MNSESEKKEIFEKHAIQAGHAWMSGGILIIGIMSAGGLGTLIVSVILWKINSILMVFGALFGIGILISVVKGIFWKREALKCPFCRVQGRFVQVDSLYEFRCPHCLRAAKTDVTIDFGGD